MRVKANTQYIYYPNMLDRIEGRTNLVPGSIVKVVNLPGCPKANTMGHAHVTYNGEFTGLVHTNSLHSLADRQLIIDAIKRDLAKSAQNENKIEIILPLPYTTAYSAEMVMAKVRETNHCTIFFVGGN